jgi:hypothetical protein
VCRNRSVSTSLFGHQRAEDTANRIRLTGGGGNFGVVTALEYQLHPVDQVLSGALTYPAGCIPDLLAGFRQVSCRGSG